MIKPALGTRWSRKRDKIVVTVDEVTAHHVTVTTVDELIVYTYPIAKFWRNYRPLP